jgi:uncharacterized protein YndB with AHSA1/START domain
MTPTHSTLATSQEQRVVVRRVIHAPVARVYAAWSDADIAARWAWGHEFDNLSVELDCRPGGQWRQAIRNRVTGTRWDFSGEFREVVPLQRVVFTFNWRSDAGDVEGPSLVRVDLSSHADGTEVVITHTELAPEKAKPTQEGWEDCLTQIGGVVA